MTYSESTGRYIRVVISIAESSEGQILSIDPWNNCPSQSARAEAQFCNLCEFWGKEVEGVDWHEYSLCLYRNDHFTAV